MIELKLNTSFNIKSSIPQEISSQINLNTLDKVRVLGPSWALSSRGDGLHEHDISNHFCWTSSDIKGFLTVILTALCAMSVFVIKCNSVSPKLLLMQCLEFQTSCLVGVVDTSRYATYSTFPPIISETFQNGFELVNSLKRTISKHMIRGLWRSSYFWHLSSGSDPSTFLLSSWAPTLKLSLVAPSSVN